MANQTFSVAREAVLLQSAVRGEFHHNLGKWRCLAGNLQFPAQSLNPTGFLAVIVVCENFMNLDGLLYDEQAAF